MPSMRMNVHGSPATDVGLQRLASLVHELHGFLVSAKRRLDEEIRCYPTPIPRCDAQFNFLYEQRNRIQDRINGIADALAIGLERQSCMNLLDGFVRAPQLTDFASEQALRSTAAATVVELEAPGRMSRSPGQRPD
jgi:hypothetical protein